MSGRDDSTAAAARLGVALLCAGAFVLVMAILAGSERHGASEKSLETAVVFALFSLPAWAGWNLARRRPLLITLGALTMIAALAAFIATLVTLWSKDLFSGEWKTVGMVVVLSVSTGQASLLLALAQDDDDGVISGVRGAGLFGIAALAALTIDEISQSGPDVSLKLMALAAVAYVLAFALIPLLRWSRR